MGTYPTRVDTNCLGSSLTGLPTAKHKRSTPMHFKSHFKVHCHSTIMFLRLKLIKCVLIGQYVGYEVNKQQKINNMFLGGMREFYMFKLAENIVWKVRILIG